MTKLNATNVRHTTFATRLTETLCTAAREGYALVENRKGQPCASIRFDSQALGMVGPDHFKFRCYAGNRSVGLLFILFTPGYQARCRFAVELAKSDATAVAKVW